MKVTFSGSIDDTNSNVIVYLSIYLGADNIRWILSGRGGSHCSKTYRKEIYLALLADYQRICGLLPGMKKFIPLS